MSTSSPQSQRSSSTTTSRITSQTSISITTSKTTSQTSILTTTITADFETYNWGPITSLYQAPTSCLKTFTSRTSNGPLYVAHHDGGYFDPSCYPPGTVGTMMATSTWNMYYYSPAVCPPGWATAYTFTTDFIGYGSGPTATTAIPLGSATSAYICCPSGWTHSKGYVCASVVAPKTTITYFYPTLEASNLAKGDTSTSSVKATTTMACHGIPIWRQATDKAVLDAVSSEPPSGLSTGAKAAIGITIPVVFLAILAGVVYIFRIRRRRSGGAEELDGNTYGPLEESRKGSEGQYVYELSRSERPVEIYTQDEDYRQSRGRVELPP